MRRLPALVLAAALLAATACGSDGKGDDVDAAVSSTSTTAAAGGDTSTTAAGGGGTGGATGATGGSGTTVGAPKLASEAELEAKLLTLADLPSGWSVDPSTSDDDGSDEGDDDLDDGMPECFRQIEEGDDEDGPSASADFILGEDLPTMSEELSSYDVKDIGSELDQAIAILDSCEDTSVEQDGVTMTVSIERDTAFPKFGDRSAAYEMTMSAQGFTFEFAIVLVAKGNVAATFAYGDLGRGALDNLRPILTKAVAKL